MKAREYAISLGLAKRGRGKLSRDAHAAIQKAIAEGQVFEDYSDGKVLKKEPNGNVVDSPVVRNSESKDVASVKVVAPLPESVVNHDYDVVWGIDDNGRSAIAIAFAHCGSCFRAIKYCLHDVPKLPAWMGGGEALITKP